MSVPLLLYFTTDTMQVASSNEVDLGDGEDPEAIRAMIRHIYDLPYDQMLVESTVDDSASYSTNEDLLFHIGAFTAADKYDVASLRPLVVKKFEGLMETNWEGENFAASVQKLIGPSAGHLADNALQTAAAAFCSKHLTKLVKKDAFVKMIHEEEPFTGRLLTGYLNNERQVTQDAITVQLKVCNSTTCIYRQPSISTLHGLNHCCVVCCTQFDSRYTELQPVNYKKARIM
jgi:hypothetical protein